MLLFIYFDIRAVSDYMSQKAETEMEKNRKAKLALQIELGGDVMIQELERKLLSRGSSTYNSNL